MDLYSKRKYRDVDANRRAAFRWFISRSEGTGSFEWICDVLGLGAPEVRKAVLKCSEMGRDAMCRRIHGWFMEETT